MLNENDPSVHALAKAQYDNLSERERVILNLIVDGYTNTEIAGRLFISKKATEEFRATVMEKLNVRTTTALIRFVLLNKL